MASSVLPSPSSVMLSLCRPFDAAPRRSRRVALCLFALSLLLTLLPPLGGTLRAQIMDTSGGEPSELFLKAFTSAQQGEKMEADGKLKSALAKYRFAASVLEQIGQNNPNWQPLIVRYRLRKTAESIQKVEQRIALAPPDQPSVSVPGGMGSAPDTVGSGDNNDLPQADDPLPGLGSAPIQSESAPSRNSAQPPPQPPPREAIDKATEDLRKRLDKTQQELKEALDKLKAAQQDKDQAIKDKRNFEFQIQSNKSDAALAIKRAERAKADRIAAEDDLEKTQKRLKELAAKNPAGSEESRKELREQVAKLKQTLAKADEESKAAAKEKETIMAKLALAEGKTADLTKQLSEAVARNELTKDAAIRIETLQAENANLTQKLTDAEAQVAKLNAESVQKKEELEGMQKELGTLKEQLVASRDQNDRSATIITELRTQLDAGAKQLEELKAKGQNSEEVAKMTKENDLLRGIVMRQLKDQARRVAAKKLLNEELEKLEVKSKTLTEQVELLGQPAQTLTDEERALFKEPQMTIADGSGDSSSMALSIMAVNPKGTEPGQPDAEAGASPAEGSAGPKVETTPQPKVSEELMPKAREAKEAFDRGKYADAEKLYAELLAREPKNPYLLSTQGVVLFKQDKVKAAEVMLRKAIKAAPDDAYSFTMIGIIYYRMHRYDDAIEALTKAITIDPKNATAHNYLGITSSQKGWPEAAEDEISKAIRLNPNYADAHFNIAVIYATNQPPAKDRAQEHYKKATALGATPDPNLEKLLQN
jgi:tetratricopeptide (TPR) repeat protein